MKAQPDRTKAQIAWGMSLPAIPHAGGQAWGMSLPAVPHAGGRAWGMSLPAVPHAGGGAWGMSLPAVPHAGKERCKSSPASLYSKEPNQ